MQNLNDLEAIKKIDPQNTLESTDTLLTQCETAWAQVNEMVTPEDFANAANIVFCGMGASIYGALVLRAMLGSSMRYPIEVVSDYHLPAYVNANTLVVLTSYSGSTEEVLSCAKEAAEKETKMLVLTKGGELAQFAKAHNVAGYIFDGTLNPSGVPRLGCGYTILGLLGLLRKTQIIAIDENRIAEGFVSLKGRQDAIKKQALEDAKRYVAKIPIIFAAEHLNGNAQILRNQFNETSKTFSSYYLVPDLNHHLMEGLQFPNPASLSFLLFHSANYSEKIKKRMQLTSDVVKKNNQELFTYMVNGKTAFEDFLEILLYGSYLTLYLALLHDQNPAVNPWVDYFKEQLK